MPAPNAVLTGDLVASSKASAVAIDRAMARLADAAGEIAAWQIGDVTRVGDTHFTRFRGDGWQILVPISRLGLRAALTMYACLAADPTLPDTRVALGLGVVDALPGPDLSNAHGSAFGVSGRLLSEIGGSDRLAVAGHDGKTSLTDLERAGFAHLNDRISDWTPEQAEAVTRVLPPHAPTQKDIAAALRISPQALSARLIGAKWPTIRQHLAAWETPKLDGAHA